MFGRPPVRGRIAIPSLCLAAAWLALVSPDAGAQASLPDGFVDELVVSSLQQPVGMAFLPDGRLLVTEQATARILLVRMQPTPQADSVGKVAGVVNGGERGLLGIAADPGWPARPYVYVHETHSGGKIRISRFAATGDVANSGSGLIGIDPASRYDLITDIPDSAGNHNGGTVRFGPDGKLYVSLGEDATSRAAQDTSSLRGVILRLDVSRLPDGPGTATRDLITPPDNPFVATNGPNGRLIWAYGLRNPFRFQIDPTDGHLYISDVGANEWEEMDEADAAGMNFGWPRYEGTADFDTGSPVTGHPNPPIAQVNHSTGAAAIISAGVYRVPVGATRYFPAAYVGDLFFSDYYAGFMRRYERVGSSWQPAAPVPGQPSSENWATGLDFVSDYAIGPDGGLWYCRQTGQIRAIRSSSSTNVEPEAGKVSFARPYPSPTRGSVRLEWRLAEPARVALSIYGADGRRIRTLVPERSDPVGRYEARWDGEDDHARSVPSGLYFVRLLVNGRSFQHRLPVIR